MRHFVLSCLVLFLAAGSAQAQSLSVGLDQSARVRLGAPARDVVIGNPAVADVSMLGARDLVVLGKSYGITNLLVMDNAGRTILQREVVVTAPPGAVNFYRGGQMRAYACAERCEQLSADDKSSSGAAAPAPAAP